jgi:Putative zinc-finger
MTCGDAQELITALVDQDLDAADRLVVEAHLKECSGCRLAFEEQRALKQKIRAAGERIHAPAQLRDKIFSDRRTFPTNTDLAQKWFGYLAPRAPVLRAAMAVALLMPLILPVYYWWNKSSQPMVLTALETYEQFERGELLVQQRSTADEIVRELTDAVGARFHPMGYDLTAMNLHPVAGLVREIDGRKILVAIYHGQGGLLLCYTFLGSEEDAPANAARFFDAEKKMTFYAFSRGKINAVLHRERDVICILASEMNMDELLTLTRTKAKPS